MTHVARTGQTVTGLPVSLNAPPSADLAGYVARYYVTIIDQPADAVTEDFLLNETAMVRILVRGDWEAFTDGEWRRWSGPLLLGAQAGALRVRARGPMAVAGFAIRPGGWFGLETAPASDFVDRVTQMTGNWGDALLAAAADIDDHHGTIVGMEAVVRDRVAALAIPPNESMARFETMARADPLISVSAAAAAIGRSQRQFERDVRRHFGHPSKTVLRRGRFLDMAAVMRGLAVPNADALAELRFYDQSHRNREFRLFTGMTPRMFEQTPTPLLTPGLEVRQQRKLQDLALLRPGETAPWLA